MLDYLFVYGTLMPGQSRWPQIKHEVIAAEQGYIEKAKLFEGPGWPFMLPNGSKENRVYGYLLTLRRENDILTVTDAIEGYPYLFDRGFFIVHTTLDREVKALAYFAADATLVDKGVLIKNGVWNGV